MRQFTLSLLLLLFVSSLSAQRFSVTSAGRVSPIERPLTNSRMVPDTILPSIFFDECANLLFFTTADAGGYVAGTNDFSDQEKAQFLRFDGADTYLVEGVVAYFAIFDTEIADRLVSANIYDLDPATNGPGNLLATTNAIEVQDLALDPVLILPTYFALDEPLLMNTSDFFVSIDFTDIYTSPTGNISLFMTEDGCGDGFNAWERWEDNTWHAIDEDVSWALESEFFIGAVVETSLPSATQNLEINLELAIYPNPATDQLNLSYSLQNSSQVTFTLLDLQGRELLHRELGNQPTGANQATIELPVLPFGLYVYQLQTANELASGRVMVR